MATTMHQQPMMPPPQPQMAYQQVTRTVSQPMVPQPQVRQVVVQQQVVQPQPRVIATTTTVQQQAPPPRPTVRVIADPSWKGGLYAGHYVMKGTLDNDPRRPTPILTLQLQMDKSVTGHATVQGVHYPILSGKWTERGDMSVKYEQGGTTWTFAGTCANGKSRKWRGKYFTGSTYETSPKGGRGEFKFRLMRMIQQAVAAAPQQNVVVAAPTQISLAGHSRPSVIAIVPGGY
jgi:hypothetical protein